MRLAGYDIPDHEIDLQATHASGPGGQNVNKVSSAIHLRFDVSASSLPDFCKARLLSIHDQRVTSQGVIVIKAQRYRSQELNRREALQRLEELIGRAMHRPRPRKATRPSAAAKRKRVTEKKARGRIKRLRDAPGAGES
ncbi:MAG: alternative ribosome rescue aminoacyl-tRNA hydrolase ArfB [Gammaproteobacteria bacterium]|nr:aminoacyl-tRNA hydrolase [Pseudomonadales bacterium]MCP5345455.1 aminoacyl-tRNA hydrolase [Pseudomonadales bacterium]